jgi:hypothetical protein
MATSLLAFNNFSELALVLLGYTALLVAGVVAETGEVAHEHT